MWYKMTIAWSCSQLFTSIFQTSKHGPKHTVHNMIINSIGLRHARQNERHGASASRANWRTRPDVAALPIQMHCSCQFIWITANAAEEATRCSGMALTRAYRHRCGGSQFMQMHCKCQFKWITANVAEEATRYRTIFLDQAADDIRMTNSTRLTA